MSIEANAKGDGASLSFDVITRYRNALVRQIARLVKPYDVEDIVQETYLRLFQAAKRQPIRSPRAFMLKTVRNLALNRLRRADALNHITPYEPGTADEEGNVPAFNEGQEERTPEVQLESKQEFGVFCSAIRALPRQCRRVFLLRRVYGLSQREVAARLGISERTVENHIAKAVVDCSDYMRLHGFPRETLRHSLSKARARVHE